MLNGAKVNVVNDDGNTPLHCAVATEDVKLVTLLLKYHADPNIKNNKGETAYDIARTLEYADIEELLAISDEMREDTNVSIEHDSNSANQDTITNLGSPESQEPPTEESRLSVTTTKILNQISKNDPFRAKKLKRQDTKKMLENVDRISKAKQKLPKLEGWLRKKQPNPPHTWQKRWVIVKDSHLLWSDRQRMIQDASNPGQRKSFNGWLNLMAIDSVQAAPSKSRNKFIVNARDAKRGHLRQYKWKAATQTDRDFWIKGLNAHKDHVQLMLDIFK